METNQKWAILGSIWFWWICTTFLYLALNFFGYPDLGYPKEQVATPIAYIAGFVGLFVPYGLMSLPLFFNPLGWVSLMVFLISMFLVDRGFNKQNFGLSKRIILNLLVLLVLTAVVDLIRLTPFQSWMIFFKGTFNT